MAGVCPKSLGCGQGQATGSGGVARVRPQGLGVWPGSGRRVWGCGQGPATGSGGVARVWPQGLGVWPGSGHGLWRCGQGLAAGSGGVARVCGGVVMVRPHSLEVWPGYVCGSLTVLLEFSIVMCSLFFIYVLYVDINVTI